MPPKSDESSASATEPMSRPAAEPQRPAAAAPPQPSARERELEAQLVAMQRERDAMRREIAELEDVVNGGAPAPHRPRGGAFKAKHCLVFASPHPETGAPVRREVAPGEVFEAGDGELEGLTHGVHFHDAE